MIGDYLRELAGQLDAVGVGGRDARRLVAEARAHLHDSAEQIGEHEALRAFGSPREIAALAAGELATARTRTAAVAAFVVLGVAGAVYAALFLTLPLAGTPDIFGGSVPGLGALALAGAVFSPQLAFVSGCLALVRVARLRRRGALPAAELSMQRWRTGVALGAGLLTLASLSAVALDFWHDIATWWVVAAIVGGIALSPALLIVAALGFRSARPLSPASGSAESVYDDLADVLARVPVLDRVRLPAEPWYLAFAVAAVAAAGVAAAGIAGGDPLDGLVRASVEALAVLACYAALGGKLGLRPTR